MKNMASAINPENASKFRNSRNLLCCIIQCLISCMYNKSLSVLGVSFVINSISLMFVPDVVWASVGVTVMTVSVTRAASMAPANNPGSVTARRDGAGSSATRVSYYFVGTCWDSFRPLYLH